MLLIYILLFLTITGLIIFLFRDEIELMLSCLLVESIIFIPLIFSLITISTGEKTYTGYVYSAEDIFDKTEVHIRYSLNAGEDSQPSFCVKKDNPLSDKFKELSGSETKLKVKVPAGFSMNMWYGQCPIEAEIIEEVK